MAGGRRSRRPHSYELKSARADVIGSPVSNDVVHRTSLPKSGPVGQIVIVGQCAGAYFAPSTGFLRWIAVGAPHVHGGASCRSLTNH